MASFLPRFRLVCGSLYAWRSPFVVSGSDNIGVATFYTRSVNVKSAGVPRAALVPASYAFKFRKSAASESAAGSGVVRSVSTAPAGRPAPWEHTPQNFPPFCRSSCTSASLSAVTSPSTWLCRGFPSFAFRDCFTSSSSTLLGRSSSSAGRKSYFMRTEQAGSMLHHQQRGYQKEQKESPLQQEYRQELQAQRHKVQYYEHRNGRHQQNRQRREQHERERQQGRSGRAAAVLAVSPLLFTQWDETSASKNELIFLAGSTLGYCTEKFLENEYGQSVFAFVLGLVYLALLGYEGKVNGAVWRMKHVFGPNMRIVGHPRYAYALPRNPLFSSSQKSPTQRNIC